MGHIATPPFRIEPELLRRQFWESADPFSFKGYRTPFEKIRISLGKSQETMAVRMKMPVDAYMDMEEGIVTPPVEDIVAFCKVAHCTPLDLYKPEANSVDPLPREIFASMIAMIAPTRETCGLKEGSIGRLRPVQPTASPADAAMGARLRKEYERGAEILQKNIDHLRPLLSAMGYSGDLDESTDPYFRPDEENDRLKPWYAAKTPLDCMMNYPEGKRAFLEGCLNQYQIMLEDDAEMHTKILNDLTNLAKTTTVAMFDTADDLFGREAGGEALGALGAMFTHSDDIEAFGRSFIADPTVIGKPVAGNLSGKEEISKKAATLFKAAQANHGLCGVVTGPKDPMPGSAELLAMSADHALKSFLEWRDDPKTQTLLDWFENWGEIYQLTLKSQELQMVPPYRGFPLAPG